MAAKAQREALPPLGTPGSGRGWGGVECAQGLRPGHVVKQVQGRGPHLLGCWMDSFVGELPAWPPP